MLVASEILEKNKANPFGFANYSCGYSILFDDLKILFLHSLSNSYMQNNEKKRQYY